MKPNQFQAYNYENHRAFTATDEGFEMIFRIRDFAERAFDLAGAVRAKELMNAAGGKGDSWDMMACIDRLVEAGYMFDFAKYDGASIPWQHRVFVRKET